MAQSRAPSTTEPPGNWGSVVTALQCPQAKGRELQAGKASTEGRFAVVRAAQKQGLARLELRFPSTSLGVQPCGDSPVNKGSVFPGIWGCLQSARQTQLLQREQTDPPRHRDSSTCQIDCAATRHTPPATARPPGPSGSTGKTSAPHGPGCAQRDPCHSPGVGTRLLGAQAHRDGLELSSAKPSPVAAVLGAGRSHGPRPGAAAGQDCCEMAAVNLGSSLETPRRASAACFQRELL